MAASMVEKMVVQSVVMKVGKKAEETVGSTAFQKVENSAEWMVEL